MFQIYDFSSGWSQSLGFGSVAKNDSVVLANSMSMVDASPDTFSHEAMVFLSLGQSVYDAYAASSNQSMNTTTNVSLDREQLGQYIRSNGGDFHIALGGNEDDENEKDEHDEGVAQREERYGIGDPKDRNSALKKEDASSADVARQAAFNTFYAELEKLDPNNELLSRLSDPDTIPSVNETKELQRAVFDLTVRDKMCPKDPEPVLPPGAPAPGTVLEQPQRLALFYESLKHAHSVSNAQEGLTLVSKTMDMIEDAYSGVKAEENPGLRYTGRMYPPRADNITENADGSITASTKRNQIQISNLRDIRIFNLNDDRSVGSLKFMKAGAQ